MATTPPFVPARDLPPIPLRPDGTRSIAPTDIAQFIRLEQCPRYLRLRMQSSSGSKFMQLYDVNAQTIPPLLTKTGADFESSIQQAVAATFPIVDLQELARVRGDRLPDNERVVDYARRLAAGQPLVLFQPRLVGHVQGWRMRGDADIVRLERDAAGALHVLIADMKSSIVDKLEHRLQVAFYVEMLAAICEEAGVAIAGMEMGVLYRGARHADPELDPEVQAEQERRRDLAERYFGTRGALLEIVDDQQAYREAVQDLVTGPDSLARQVAEAPFEDVPYHLSYRCDGCMYNEFCMKWTAEHDDLSLLPHLSALDKDALQQVGIATATHLAQLKEPALDDSLKLVPAAGFEALARELSTTWPVGPRVDELVFRARGYRRSKGDEQFNAPPFIPGKGYSSLPYVGAEQNPNLVYIYIDAQNDYLHDRLYLIGSRVVACEDGVPVRRKSVVHLSAGPPESARQEEQLLVRWIEDTIAAVVTLAAPDAEGELRAPIHLMFFNRWEQRLLLEGLARHFQSVLAATPLYDFVTQLAAFDSPLATFLDQELRQFKNYPLVCPSLQAVAGYLGFKWNEPEPYRDVFRARLFDFWRRFEDESDQGEWYFGRARFSSQIPLEYAYAAWGELDDNAGRRGDPYRRFRGATLDLLRGFQTRRLEALEHIAGHFSGNRDTTKTAFALPDLTAFHEKAENLAQALDEFVTIERHVELAAWKQARLASPEQRVLNGETLLVRYRDTLQDPDVAAQNRDNERRRLLQEEYRAAYRAANPDAKQVRLPKDQKEASDWSQDGLVVRLELVADGLDCTLDEAMALTGIREGDYLVLHSRWTVDSRKPVDEQTPLTPTPKQMLYGQRGVVRRIELKRDAEGRVSGGLIEFALRNAFGGAWSRGFLFPTSFGLPMRDAGLYTLDGDPNNISGYWSSKVTEGLRNDEPNALYNRLTGLGPLQAGWPPAAAEAQARFLAGLDALAQRGALHPFEPSKRAYIGSHGDAPMLLVQGPPGTGKSYATAYALFARLQGAMAAGREFRAMLACKTHAATDVLMENALDIRRRLAELRDLHPDVFRDYFDPRLLEVPIYRLRPSRDAPEGAIVLRGKRSDEPAMIDTVLAREWCIAAATPGSIYSALDERWKNNIFGHELSDCLVLDEASQMNLPEALMAALPLKQDGQLIVVGDHRQMPPIIKHRWDDEPRRTFKEFRSYASLFEALLALRPPMIKFEESFRLHADMAAFLRQEIYRHDGIPYFSQETRVLPASRHADPFVAAVLAPAHPLVVVVHDEGRSQQRNPFEQQLIEPVLRALADPLTYGFEPLDGLGVVVPHRAQRAALQDALPMLVLTDPETGVIRLSAVDTVERFQGGEREVIIVSATESDRNYLLQAGEFLLDPRRLTVALSRAKQKVVLVASRSVFNLFSADEEVFASAQLWKNLLRRTCTELLWSGERHGQQVEVWGNRSSNTNGHADST